MTSSHQTSRRFDSCQSTFNSKLKTMRLRYVLLEYCIIFSLLKSKITGCLILHISYRLPSFPSSKKKGVFTTLTPAFELLNGLRDKTSNIVYNC